MIAEGITDIPLSRRVSEAIFSGNALLSVNDATPYNAVYGRVPNLLPDINTATLDGIGALPGTIRHSSRLREIAIQKMVEQTACDRIDRASHTRTQHPSQHRFHEGDEVDYYRPPSQKDMPGWTESGTCLLYTSPSPRDLSTSRMPSSA